LRDRVGIVTGGARGLGAEIARAMAEEGARVVIADIRDELGGETAERLRAGGAEVEYEHLDVREPSDWAAAVERARRRWGSPEVLVNNAAILRLEGIADESEDAFQEVLDVALTGAFHGLRAVLPGMRALGRGAIVNVSSTAALAAVPDAAAYHAAKGGLLALSRAAAVAYARDGIRVNALVPGSMRTPMVDEFEGLSELQDAAVRATPVGRALAPREVAAAAIHLLADDASYTVGTALIADGGYLAV
jgi:NAD(P)-dependent dehydrogenase (short-subunit alcohol dehydrogenase family)